MQKLAKEDLILEFIKSIREEDPCIGGVKLWHMYIKEFDRKDCLGRDCFCNIIDKYNLKIRKKARKPKTTDSSHGLRTYPNLIKDFIPTAVNQLWVSDITYIPIWVEYNKYVFCYLSLVLDCYSEEIVGWSIGDTLEVSYPIEALEMALKRIVDKTDINLIHHSDRGCQYASYEYVSLLNKYNIRISMTESGNPKDNAQAERINNTIKNELLNNSSFESLSQVKQRIKEAVEFYNTKRPHMSVDMKTPKEAALLTGEINKKWKSYRLIAIKSRQNENEITEKSLPSNIHQESPYGLRPSVDS